VTALLSCVVCAAGDGLPTLGGDRRWLPTHGGTAHRVASSAPHRRSLLAAAARSEVKGGLAEQLQVAASAPTGQGMLATLGCGLWVGVAAGLRVVQAVAQVEHGSLGVDRGQVVEVVVGWG
jgi:hypothetical protein